VKNVLLVLCCALTGCAPMTAQQCAGANWYEQGERDALYSGIQPRFDQLSHVCTLPDRSAAERSYMEGWAAGYSEHQRRVDRQG
jgi:hypothetical protein